MEPNTIPYAQLEEELETQRIANQQLVRELAVRDGQIALSRESRTRLMSTCQSLLEEQAEHEAAILELTKVLRDLGELQGVPVLQRAVQLLRIHEMSLKSQKIASGQVQKIVTRLQAERDGLRQHLIDAECEVARLQLLVSIPMSPKEAAADSAPSNT